MFDASTIVGAALSATGVPRQALVCAEALHTIAMSIEVFAEIDEVLSRPKFAAIVGSSLRVEILLLLTRNGVWIESDVRVTDCRDPDDNKYLELALAAGAEAVVSSDDDLLALDPWRGVRILRGRHFLAIVG